MIADSEIKALQRLAEVSGAPFLRLVTEVDSSSRGAGSAAERLLKTGQALLDKDAEIASLKVATRRALEAAMHLTGKDNLYQRVMGGPDGNDDLGTLEDVLTSALKETL